MLNIERRSLIEEKRPSINIQPEGFDRILKLFDFYLFNIIISNCI